MYNLQSSYQSLDGILSRINYAHVDKATRHGSRIEYLLGKSVMFEELEPYNRKFGEQPIAVELEFYTNFYKHSRKYSPSVKYDSAAIHQNYYFDPEILLKTERKPAQFIADASEMKSFVEEAFEKLVNEKLPENIIIQLCSPEEMHRIHSSFGSWNDGIMGFSLNGNSQGTSHIFVRKGPLDKVMVILGHELGHVFTRTLENAQDEEAKAFAFCFAWVKTIKDHNIGNLGDAIDLEMTPAENNIHDVSFNFVQRKVAEGIKALELHWDLVRRYVSLVSWHPAIVR